MNNKDNVRNDGQSMRKIVTTGDAAKGQAMRPAPVPIREGQAMPAGTNAPSLRSCRATGIRRTAQILEIAGLIGSIAESANRHRAEADASVLFAA